MLLYRVLSSYEMKKLMGKDASAFNRSCLWGNNTFCYEPNAEYIHFFKYAQHAKLHLSKFGVIIAQFNIPDDLIDQHGFGFYNSDISVIPECIIKKENFDINFLEGFQYELKVGWCRPNIPLDKLNGRYIPSYGELYEELFKNLIKSFNIEKPNTSLNLYVVNKLKDKELNNLLIDYIDIFNGRKNIKSKKSIFKRK